MANAIYVHVLFVWTGDQSATISAIALVTGRLLLSPVVCMDDINLFQSYWVSGSETKRYSTNRK